MAYVLILGAASDVAVACAYRFAKEKYDLYLAGRDLNQLNVIASDIQIKYGVTAAAVLFDALQFDKHQSFYNSLDPKPEVAICVFGLLGDQSISAKNWDACKTVIESNFTGAVSILNVIANQFEERKSGVIVGISSVAGERGRQSNYIYGSAKAGFTTYLSGMRNRLVASGVHVVTVKPGFINTKMTEDIKLPKPITAQPAQLGEAIFRAVEKKKDIIYVLGIWRLIMLIIRNIPEGIFKKLKF